MGRRSDHSREELEELILAEGHGLLAETGYARFSAREVAKRIGYSIGTIYNVFGSLDALLLAINSRTFVLWAAWLREKLAVAGDDRIAALVAGYFDFAERNPNLWMAIYDHRQPPGTEMPEGYRRLRSGLTGIVEAEIAHVLPQDRRGEAPALARSLVALVHGHCEFALNGTFALLGEQDPQAAALARVREALAAGGATGAAVGRA
ncbi:TetR/AcrR family transcriptional regulator [Sphingomonas sp. QA11]|uniref:TetR/AcrR family transcriptional regulator n=1 Tax=Sphingomonas sp. QA11 TaxID=2950605 RepID=UPI00234B5C6E|nr:MULTISPECIES: TetR/AcrR family transcriptional regulator [unclassified Sphingomonas]WCM27754.1 TetR/AcrR family transcriptional regulator [Sphingomonas sp. QA11]WEK02440.1 MAG: TetR/AcrR family transcriptional regulator [Sphingomonas sp.]